MQYINMSKVLLIISMSLTVFCNQSVMIAKEADELEEALMVKLLEKRAKKRTGDDTDSARLEKTDLNFLKGDDKSEISVAVVNDVKNVLKEPFLALLASSELISWVQLGERVSAAKKALEVFEVKYRAELASGGKSAATPMVATMPGSQGVVMPGARVATMPGAKGVTMPGAKGVTMPGVQKATANADDEEEEDEDEPVVKQKPVISVMPGVQTKPLGGMPGIVAAPAGIPTAAPMVASGIPKVATTPIAAPTGMPGVALLPALPPVAAPVASGMPMAK